MCISGLSPGRQCDDSWRACRGSDTCLTSRTFSRADQRAKHRGVHSISFIVPERRSASFHGSAWNRVCVCVRARIVCPREPTLIPHIRFDFFIYRRIPLSAIDIPQIGQAFARSSLFSPSARSSRVSLFPSEPPREDAAICRCSLDRPLLIGVLVDRWAHQKSGMASSVTRSFQKFRDGNQDPQAVPCLVLCGMMRHRGL